MKFILQLSVIIVAAFSCKPSSPAADTRLDPSGCYRMRIKNDTATINLAAHGDSVSGSLNYHWAEKDHNDGSFAGSIYHDSLIVADYTFLSEGTSSVRQVVFKIKQDTLLQGYGELQMRNDTSVFRDVDLVIFDRKNPFVKGCQ